jgi:hypothetical protein
LKKAGALAITAALGLTACGSAHHRVPASWRAVADCLERHPGYAGKVTADDSGGPGGRGSLLLVLTDRRFVKAYRFASPRAARAGVGPPGETVTYYGSVAVLPSSESHAEVRFMKSCFAHGQAARRA